MDRFWSKVDTSSNCWLWLGGATKTGYGQFRLDGQSRYAHRVAYELAIGPIPDGMEVDHICRVRRCVNPQHLRVATHKQNQENRNGADRRSTSKVRGVFWNKAQREWRVQVRHNRKLHWGGSYQSLDEAEDAAIALRRRLFTHNEVDQKGRIER